MSTFLQQLQLKRDQILMNNTVRESSLNNQQKNNIYNELDHIYSNDFYPKMESTACQTEPYYDNLNKNKLPLCSFFCGATLITLSLLTINNFLIYYFTTVEFN